MAAKDSITTLYNGEYTVVYKDAQHRYTVDGVRVPSVTTILGTVIAKPDLMLWPLNLAMKQLEQNLSDGEVLTNAHLQHARAAHIQKRDKGSSTGTAVHAIVEKRLAMEYGRVLLLDNLPREVVVAALAFEAWYKRVRPKVIGIEKVVYSPTFGYCGTYDSILKIRGKTYLCDLKTTNASRIAPQGVYPEYFIQLGAYYAAYEEQRLYEGLSSLPAIDDLLVISARKDGVVDTVALSSLGLTPDDAAGLWRSALELYLGICTIKKQLAKGNV